MPLRVYQDQLDQPVAACLELCDVVTFWTMRGQDLGNLERIFERFEALTPGHRRVLGHYMWDYGAQQPMPVPAMRRQVRAGPAMAAPGPHRRDDLPGKVRLRPGPGGRGVDAPLDRRSRRPARRPDHLSLMHRQCCLFGLPAGGSRLPGLCLQGWTSWTAQESKAVLVPILLVRMLRQSGICG
jgi:hypothetical protein